MSLGQLTSSALFACEPSVRPLSPAPPVTEIVTATLTETFTKTWLYTAWAACPTSEWPATYTIEEVCTGDPATWIQPTSPPNFIETVVTCGVCVEKTQTITCPVEEAARTGQVTIYGNGVTATPAAVLAQPTGSGMDAGPGSGMDAGPGSRPGADTTMSGAMPGTGSGPGANSGPEPDAPAPAPAPGPGSGSSSPAPDGGAGLNGAGSGPEWGGDPAAPGAGSGSTGSPHPGMGAGGGSPAGAPVPVPNNNNGNPGPWSSPPAPNLGSESGPAVAQAPADGDAAGSSATTLMPESDAGKNAASSTYVTAGAPSPRSALLVVSGIFTLVSSSIVCY